MKEAVIGDEQTRVGVFDLSDWWASDGPGHAAEPVVEDFVGPVEIRKAQGMGRGLFATQDVEAGQLLFATGPLVSTQSVRGSERDDTTALLVQLERIISKAQRNLQTFPELQRLVQVDTLLGPCWKGTCDAFREAPPMRFFRPVNCLEAKDRVLSSTDIQHPALKARFTTKVLKKISLFNLTRSSISVPQVGIYSLGSLMNHSCLPNAHLQYVQVGSVKFARASRQVKAGEQLFFSYFTLLAPLEERRRTMGGEFCCTCARWALEERLLVLVPGLRALEARCTSLWKRRPGLDAMSKEDKLKMRAACVTTIEQVETILNKDQNCVGLGEEKKNWIRSSFVPLYRLLLDPNLVLVVLIKRATLEQRKEEQRLIYQAVAAIRAVDPASPMALSLMALEHLVGLPDSTFKTLSTIRETCQMIYGVGLKEEAYFRQFQSSAGFGLLDAD